MKATRLLAGLIVWLMVAGGTVATAQNEQLANRKSEWDKMKQRIGESVIKVDALMTKSRNLRAMDKTELDSLITQICKLDVARNDDEADRLAKSIAEKVVAKVQAEYDSINYETDRLEDDVERVLSDARAIHDATKGILNVSELKPEVKDETVKLLQEMSAAIENYNLSVYKRLTDDYRALTNLKEGVLKGSNNPRIRASMEYGKEKHIYNQRICEEKELSLSSGRPDCVSFQKDNCAVWEFKPDTYSEADAKWQAGKYLSDVQERFKDDKRAIENCKKDSYGRPIFEARPALYPACRP